jgi:DNA-binding transcriptional MerR regulator
MSRYTVKQLARLSGVSVRALHHYDEIGLLKPAFLGENRYRYYGREELLRLQDVLFHRELGLPLQDIALLLDPAARDRLAILRDHRERLARQVERSRQLLTTIDRTIAELSGEGTMDDNEWFKGFSPEKQAEHEQYLVDRFGPAMRTQIDRSKERFAEMSDEHQHAALEEGGAVESELVERFHSGLAPENERLEPSLERHRNWLERMVGQPYSPLAYAGLADLYSSHDGYRERYERHGAGFTDWLVQAMKASAGRMPAT